MSRQAPITLITLLMISTAAWPQRGGSRSTGTVGHSVPDPGARYGVGVPPPLAITTTNSRHAEDEQRVEFKSETVLVEVPVVVTDKSGTHMRNLAKGDFHLFENGKEQKIATFEFKEVSATPSPIAAPPAKAGEFTNVSPDMNKPRTLSIIAIDSINTPYLDQAYGRKELIKYLSENLDPGQTQGLVLIGGKGVRVLHGLTSDPAQLVAAVKKVNGEIPPMQGFDSEAQVAAASQGISSTPSGNMSPRGGFAPDSAGDAVPMVDIAGELRDFVLKGDAIVGAYEQSRAIEMTLHAFLNIANYVSGIPGRKALIWATGSFPFTIDAPSAVPGGEMATLYERAMQALNDADLAVYPVDIRGLVNYTPVADPTYSGGHYGPQIMNAAVGRSWLHASSIDTLRDFAAMTGGRAFYNTNDLAGSFHKAAADSSAYYVLSYYLDTHNNRPGWRQLKVKVNKPDVEVRARNGFFVTNATMNPGVTRVLDEESALNSPFDIASVPITLRWLGMTPDGEKRKVNFSVAIPSNGVLINEAAENSFNIDVAAIVTTDKGLNAGRFSQPLQGKIKPESLSLVKTQGVSFRNMFELSPGQYTVKMMVRDNLTGKLGSVSAPLTVN